MNIKVEWEVNFGLSQYWIRFKEVSDQEATQLTALYSKHNNNKPFKAGCDSLILDKEECTELIKDLKLNGYTVSMEHDFSNIMARINATMEGIDCLGPRPGLVRSLTYPVKKWYVQYLKLKDLL